MWVYRSCDCCEAAKYRNAGQTCVCPNRILVQEGIYDAYVARLTERVKDIQVGHGLQPGVHQVSAEEALVWSPMLR